MEFLGFFWFGFCLVCLFGFFVPSVWLYLCILVFKFKWIVIYGFLSFVLTILTVFYLELLGGILKHCLLKNLW